MITAPPLPVVGRICRAPSLVVERADLRLRVAVLEKDICVEELACHWGSVLRRMSDIVGGLCGAGCSAAVDIEESVVPRHILQVCVCAVAVERSVDGGVSEISRAIVAGHCGELCGRVAVGACNHDLEVASPLTRVDRVLWCHRA